MLSLTRPAEKTTTPSASIISVKNQARNADRAPSAVLRLKLLGANTNSPISGQQQQNGKVNYFLGNEAAQWHSNIALYGQVLCQQVYPGIDLLYYGSQQQLEYDYVVAPGADTSKIRLEIQGARKIEIEPRGDLSIQTPSGKVSLHAPRLYQQIGKIRQRVSGSYVLSGHNVVGFQVSPYDHTRPLVIDPVLSYST